MRLIWTDPDLTGNLDLNRYVEVFGSIEVVADASLEVLDTVRLQLVNSDQPASYWVMDGSFTTEIMLRSIVRGC